MPNVRSVRLGLIYPGVFYRDNSQPVAETQIPASYYFGHTVEVMIEADDIPHCRLYWAESTNVPIIDEQNPGYFVDMYKLRSAARTFRTWPGRDVTIKDTPAILGGVGAAGIQYRWLKIIAIVHNTTDNSARKAYVRQDLLYYPAGGEGAARAEFVHRIGGWAPPNLQQAGGGIRNYSYQIIQDNVVLANPAVDIPAIFNGALPAMWL